MSRKPVARTRLRIEPLEKRLMLDGNVLVEVVDGDLIITGDNLDNAIEIEAGWVPGEPQPAVMGYQPPQYIVSGRPTGSGDDVHSTTVNGETDIAVHGVTGDVRISLRGGDDSVTIQGRWSQEYDPIPSYCSVFVANDLIIATSSGDDFVYLQGVEVGDDLVINTGRGQDTVIDHGVEVVDDAIINTSLGNDTVKISAVTIVELIPWPPEILLLSPWSMSASLFSRVGGNATINTRAGEDDVRVLRATIAGDLIVRTGSDADSLEIVHSEVGDDAVLTTGRGNDLVGIHESIVADAFRLSTGKGNDSVSVSTWDGRDDVPEFGLKAKRANVRTGSGDDYVEFTASRIDRNLRVDLGSDDDELYAVANEVAIRAYLNGETGADTVNQDIEEANDFAWLRFWGF